MPACNHCHQVYAAPIYKNTVCSSCGKELKTCRNCEHFAPGMANDCREPVSEPVTEKDRSNFCDWFTPAAEVKSVQTDSRDTAARQAFSSLFGDD